MEWALLGVAIVFLFVAYIIVQGTRAAMAWRRAAAAGDVDVIRRILDEAIEGWRSMRMPKTVPADVWRGIQSAEIVEVGPDWVQLSCQAQSDYRMIEGQWVEAANPLQEGMAITARTLDMVLYDIPNLKAQRVQVDVYTSFRETNGAARFQCILSTSATREAARRVDWDEWSAAEIVDALGGRYRLTDSGQPEPVRPIKKRTPKKSATAGAAKNGAKAAIRP
jgi:hypothetical protein